MVAGARMRLTGGLLLLLLMAAVAVGEPEHECVLMLANGDRMTGRVAGLSGTTLSFHPSVAPETVLAVDLAKVERLSFPDGSEQEPAEASHVLTLRDGSLLHGSFVALTEETLTFDLRGVGPLEFPRALVEELSRTGLEEVKVEGNPEKHVIVTTENDVLQGNFGQEAEGLLVVAGGAVTVKLPPSSLRTVFFPVPGQDDAPVAEEELTTLATLADGTCIAGGDPFIKGDVFSLTLSTGQRVTFPMTNVSALAFTVVGAADSRRQVLFWGCYADRSEEHARAVAALTEQLGPRWKITENFSETFDREFVRDLARSRALVVSEMERWRSSRLSAVATKFKPLAEGFLERGGNIIFLGVTGNQARLLKESGLLDVEPLSNRGHVNVPFTQAGQGLAKDVGTSFRTTNSTQFYRFDPDTEAVALAETSAGAPAVGRKVGQGWVVLLGMDFYESSDETKQILQNAVTMK